MVLADAAAAAVVVVVVVVVIVVVVVAAAVVVVVVVVVNSVKSRTSGKVMEVVGDGMHIWYIWIEELLFWE